MWKNDQQEGNAIPQCSFCGKSQDRVSRLTGGPGNVYICNECVDLYRDHLEKVSRNPIAIKEISHTCPSCGTRSPGSHRYCFNCGYQYTEKEIHL